MFLFIWRTGNLKEFRPAFKYILCSYSSNVLYNELYFWNLFKYILCSYSSSSISPTLSYSVLFKYILCSYSSAQILNNPLYEPLFKYILCSYSSGNIHQFPFPHLHSNTSYVLIHLSLLVCRNLNTKIQIHPMFLFIIRISKAQIPRFNSNTSYVLIHPYKHLANISYV